MIWDAMSQFPSKTLRTLHLDNQDISGNGTPGIAAATIVVDDFGDPLGICLVGKLLNNADSLLKELYNTGGYASVIFFGTTPLAHAGFEHPEEEAFDRSTLQIPPEIAADVLRTETRTHLVLTLAGDKYISSCSALQSVDQEHIGIICIGIPESQVRESQQTLLAYGLEMKHNLQAWIVGIGAVSLSLFIGISFVIAAKIVNPLRRLSDIAEEIAAGDVQQAIPVTSHDEIGELFGAMRKMVSNLKGTIQVAEQIAQGGLTVSVNVLSEKDTLGKSLSAMVEKLREIVGDVKTAAEKVASGSLTMSSGSAEMSQGASEQAAAAEEAAASMEQMIANIRQNADNALQTEKIAIRAAEDAQKGGVVVAQTVSAMQKIVKKIAIVEEIACQTHMLSLNATIEAARAEEYGKGFGVVTSEVRALAERSQAAVTEINQVAGESIAVAEKAGEMLAKLVPDIQKTAKLVQEISAASNEQNSSGAQINRAIQQLDQVIQQNSATSEEMAATAEELASQAEQLQHTIAVFRVDERGQEQLGV